MKNQAGNGRKKKKNSMKNYVLITGATSGIGYELAKIFAKNEHSLLLISREKTTLEKVKKELKTYPIDIEIFSSDLSKSNSANKILEFVKLKKINIDILINNAGFGLKGKFIETDLEKELNMIDLNVKALTSLTKLFIPILSKNKNSKILNVASTAAFQPGPLMAVYYATKAYVLSFSNALYEELKPLNIHVSTLCPGATETNFAKTANLSNTLLFKTAMTAEKVALVAYKGLMKNKRVIIPGYKNKFLKLIIPFTPIRLILKVVKRIQS